jgi:hypothetical protein
MALIYRVYNSCENAMYGFGGLLDYRNLLGDCARHHLSLVRTTTDH